MPGLKILATNLSEEADHRLEDLPVEVPTELPSEPLTITPGTLPETSVEDPPATMPVEISPTDEVISDPDITQVIVLQDDDDDDEEDDEERENESEAEPDSEELRVYDLLTSFFRMNPSPTDEEMHALATAVRMSAEELEQVIYRVMSVMMEDPESISEESDLEAS